MKSNKPVSSRNDLTTFYVGFRPAKTPAKSSVEHVDSPFCKCKECVEKDRQRVAALEAFPRELIERIDLLLSARSLDYLFEGNKAAVAVLDDARALIIRTFAK
jgi:hypothetical protein